VSVAAAIPGARGLRRRVRRARRAHHGRPIGELLNDLYLLVWVFGVYGSILATAIVRHLHGRGAPVPVDSVWLGVAALLVAAGLSWRLLRTVGPVIVTPAERTWIVSSPVDRARWLRPRVLLLLLGTSILGAAVAAIGGVAVRSATIGWGAVAGAGVGLALAAGAVAVQRGAAFGVRAGAPAWVLTGVGLALAGVVVVAGRVGRTLPAPPGWGGLAVAVVALPLAAASSLRAWRGLDRLDAAALGAGAQVATAGLTAAVGLDLSLFLNVLEARRWRRVGSVRSRPFHAWRAVPWMVLLEAEARRLLRRPDAAVVWGALALAQYALTLAAPGPAPFLRLVLAYVVGNRLTSGLRTLSRAPGLARGLAVSEHALRALHLVVPALAVALWWVVTAPASGAALGRGDLALVAGVVGSVYRAATRPPMSYEGAAVETPFGLFPVELLQQMVRGPDLLGATLLARMLLLRG